MLSLLSPLFRPSKRKTNSLSSGGFEIGCHMMLPLRLFVLSCAAYSLSSSIPSFHTIWRSHPSRQRGDVSGVEYLEKKEEEELS